MKTILVTLTGPACSGKSTLERLLTSHGFVSVVSTTTRAPRDGELDGVAYHFTDRSRFECMRGDGELIESVEFNGNLYAVTAAEIARISDLGKPAIVVCEPHGQKQIAAYAKARDWVLFSIFVDAPVSLVTKRFLERLVIDCREIAEDKAIITYANRLTTLITEELKWKENFSSYDLYLEKFDQDTEKEIVKRIMDWMKYQCTRNT